MGQIFGSAWAGMQAIPPLLCLGVWGWTGWVRILGTHQPGLLYKLCEEVRPEGWDDESGWGSGTHWAWLVHASVTWTKLIGWIWCWAPGWLTRAYQYTIYMTWLSLVVRYDLDRLWSGGLTRLGPTLEVVNGVAWLELGRVTLLDWDIGYVTGAKLGDCWQQRCTTVFQIHSTRELQENEIYLHFPDLNERVFQKTQVVCFLSPLFCLDSNAYWLSNVSNHGLSQLFLMKSEASPVCYWLFLLNETTYKTAMIQRRHLFCVTD